MRAVDVEVLALPRVLEALARLAASEPGAERCRTLRPLAERADAERALDRQWSFYRLLEVAGTLPLQAFPDVRDALVLAAHEGAVLPAERLVAVRTVLREIASVQHFLRARIAEFPALADLPARLQPMPELERALTRMLDETGVLRDDASPRLAELRRALRDLRQEVEERLGRLVTAGTGEAGIADQYVTLRNNRFVVPVRAGASGRLGGVVQDRSASGETLFVEPLFAIELNNHLLLLAKEEEAEETRLLTLLTGQVGAVRHDLGRACAALAEVDALGAGAHFAHRFACVRPQLGDGVVDLRAARHPELLLAGQHVVPVDVHLPPGKRALVVSGPNTGGKTVALKTLGLLTLLAHSGLLIPAEEGSTVPWVASVFTDLADAQSIERNLSTFSAHVENLVAVFQALRLPALVLLDEPGGGTDPEEGAALAVAVIDRLLAAGCLVAVATHYAPVKLWALGDPRVELAAVDVDPATFEPRYRIAYGSVGESLGLAMARRLRLPAEVLTAAEARRPAAARELAAAIGRLEESRRRLEDERAAVADERTALAQLEREHAGLLAELHERRRTRWREELEDARAFVRGLKAEGRTLLEEARRGDEAARRALRSYAARAEGAIAERTAVLDEPDVATTGDHRPPAVGEHVSVHGTAIHGELVALEGERARVRRGALTFEVPAAQLRRAAGRAAPAPTPARSAPAPLVEPSSELMLIGLRVREALDRLERYLDGAQSAGMRSVRIVHGLGTGALKRAVAEYLATSPYCRAFADAPGPEGGAGVTVVEFL